MRGSQGSRGGANGYADGDTSNAENTRHSGNDQDQRQGGTECERHSDAHSTSTATESSEANSGTDSSATASTGTTDTHTSSTNSTGPGPGPGYCPDFVDKLIECATSPGEAGSLQPVDQYCKDVRELHAQISGDLCVPAFDDDLACYGGTNCEKLDNGDACDQELQTDLQTCNMPAINTCIAYLDKTVECKIGIKDPLSDCLYSITYDAQNYDNDCAIAQEEVYACLSLLSCAAFKNHAG
ncbi:MAG TPA: hypothetical protein ENJ18_16880, partial [Nannocystis exedens]|nr:hypothetical protein [Nannocystis exedens]